MQYEIKDTVGFPVVANVDVPLRVFDANDAPSTLWIDSAGTNIGTSTGVFRQVSTASRGNIIVLEVESNGWGTVYVDLSKVYFTTNFGANDTKHSVKGSAYYDENDTTQPTENNIVDENGNIIDKAKKIIDDSKDLYDSATGKLIKKGTTTKKPIPNAGDNLQGQGIDWAMYLKWGLVATAVGGAIFLIVYLVKDNPSQIKDAQPKNDVPTLQGVNIPKPQKLS
jgi:hypothetical protein